MRDREFLRYCLSLGKEGWQELIGRYCHLIYGSIYAVAHKYGNRWPANAVEDIFQEVVLSLFEDNCRRLRSFKGKNNCSLGGWLRQVAINHAIDYLRRQAREVSLDSEDEDGMALVDVLASNCRDVREDMDKEDLLRRLSECIDILDAEEKYFVDLHFWQGVHQDALARHLAISRQAVDMRKTRIVKRLRECFRRKGFR